MGGAKFGLKREFTGGEGEEGEPRTGRRDSALGDARLRFFTSGNISR